MSPRDKDFPIKFVAFIFTDRIEPLGHLPRSHPIQASACWYFAKLATQALDSLAQQVSYEGDTDVTTALRTIADRVAQIYNVKLEDYMPFIDDVEREARRSNLFWNDKVTAWVATGGRAYNVMTRDPGALEQ